MRNILTGTRSRRGGPRSAGARILLSHAMPKTTRTILTLLPILAGALLSAALPACSTSKSKPPVVETEDTYKRAIEAAQRGDALRKKEKWEGAAQAYRESLALKSDLGPVWLNMGVCLMNLGDYVPARDAFVKAVDLLPGDPRPYENLGFLYHTRRYDEEALRAYSESLRIAPSYQPSLRGAVLMAKYTRTVSYEALDRAERALFAETNPDYMKMMQAERLRLQQALKDRERVGTQ